MVTSFMLQPAQADGLANAQHRTNRNNNRQNGDAIERFHTVILIISFFYFVLIILHVMSGSEQPGWFTQRFQCERRVLFNMSSRRRLPKSLGAGDENPDPFQEGGAGNPCRTHSMQYRVQNLSLLSEESIIRSVAKFISPDATLLSAPLAFDQQLPGRSFSRGTQNVPLHPAIATQPLDKFSDLPPFSCESAALGNSCHYLRREFCFVGWDKLPGLVRERQ